MISHDNEYGDDYFFRIVPKATVISMFSVIVLYLLTNVAYFTVMSPSEMMAAPAVAVVRKQFPLDNA